MNDGEQSSFSQRDSSSSVEPPQRIRIMLKRDIKKNKVEQKVEEEKMEIEKIELPDEKPPDNESLNMNLIGFKSQDEGEVLFCWKCDYPIAIYGRVVPCSHVFCYECASSRSCTCPRCRTPADHVEERTRAPLFVCIFGGAHPQDKLSCMQAYTNLDDISTHLRRRHSIEEPEGHYIKAFFPATPQTPKPSTIAQIESLLSPSQIAELLAMEQSFNHLQ